MTSDLSLQVAERLDATLEPTITDADLLRWEAFFDTAAAIGARTARNGDGSGV